MEYLPSSEFCAACRIVLGADTADVISVALGTALSADIQQAYDDIVAGRRRIQLPLVPPPGKLSDPSMVTTLQIIADRRLDAASARAVVRGQMMARAGDRLTAQRNDKKENAMPTRKAWIALLEDSTIWLYENDDFKGDEESIHLVRVTHQQLRETRPRLYPALEMSRYPDTPKIVREP
jgi:hypothetical protein